MGKTQNSYIWKLPGGFHKTKAVCESVAKKAKGVLSSLKSGVWRIEAYGLILFRSTQTIPEVLWSVTVTMFYTHHVQEHSQGQDKKILVDVYSEKRTLRDNIQLNSSIQKYWKAYVCSIIRETRTNGWDNNYDGNNNNSYHFISSFCQAQY